MASKIQLCDTCVSLTRCSFPKWWLRVAEAFDSSLLYNLNSPFLIVKELAAISVFILGWFARFVVSSDLEVKAEIPEDTAR